jgi:hypothetical protein
MDDNRLRAHLHAALQAAENGAQQPRTPAFATLWRAAQQPSERARVWPAPLVYASLAAAALIAVFVLRTNPVSDLPPDSADADLILAQQLAASDPWRVPTDRLLDAAPVSLASGAPSIPEFQYPLLPKERYL